jgi:hypothetical protein
MKHPTAFQPVIRSMSAALSALLGSPVGAVAAPPRPPDPSETQVETSSHMAEIFKVGTARTCAAGRLSRANGARDYDIMP